MNLNCVINDPMFKPERKHENDAGLDLKITEDVILHPGGCRDVGTGVRVQIPCGYVGLVFIRSGVAFKDNVTIRNGVGVIDSGYVGEIRLPLVNLGDSAFVAKKGQRLAQLVVLPIVSPDIVLVDSLEDSDRGTNGFGSTGR